MSFSRQRSRKVIDLGGIDLYKTSLELAKAIAKAAADKKGRDVVLMNMVGLSPATDYFVICSAGSTTQVKAISDKEEFVQ